MQRNKEIFVICSISFACILIALLHYQRSQNSYVDDYVKIKTIIKTPSRLSNALLNTLNETIGRKLKESNENGGAAQTVNLTCNIPLLHPFDAVVLESIAHHRRYECPEVQPLLTFVDEFNYLHYNVTELQLIGATTENVRCNYSMFERANGTNDDKIASDTWQELKVEEPVALDRDFVLVTCWNSSGAEIYFEAHAVISNRSGYSTLTGAELLQETEDNLSVVMIYIDSASQTMVPRNLPATYWFMRETLGTFFFQRYNKAGSNSFPNMIPILTGKFPYSYDPGMEQEFGDVDFSIIQYDDWPLIWKNYSTHGYATLFNEDSPELGLFHYLANGFAKKPVDHSMRPFWQTIYSKTNLKKSLCWGNHFMLELQLNIMRRMFAKYNGVRKFAYNFFIDLLHNDATRLEIADELLYNFFKDMYNAGYLNKTVIIFSADHGPRFGGPRDTIYGDLENKLPIMSLTFPNWFLRNNQRIAASLDRNRFRLTANFDVYQTLVDILNGNYKGKQQPPTKRGLSLLYDIPLTRTCYDAGVALQFCACATSKPLNTTDTSAINAGQRLVDFINEFMWPYNASCTKLNFQSVIKLEQYEVQRSPETQETVYSITVSIGPSNGSVSALVAQNSTATSKSPFEVLTKIESVVRQDRYYDQSLCIAGRSDARIAERFCYCRTLLERRTSPKTRSTRSLNTSITNMSSTTSYNPTAALSTTLFMTDVSSNAISLTS